MSVRALIVKSGTPIAFAVAKALLIRSAATSVGYIFWLSFARVFKIDSHYTLVNNCFDTIFKTITIAILLIGAEWFLEFLCN